MRTRSPARVDEAWVSRAAADHLARYTTTRAHLRTLLRGRVRRAVQRGAEVDPDIEASIDAVLDRHVVLGTLDDAAWAEARARVLTRRGVAAAVVTQRLREKGVADAATAMSTVLEEQQGADDDAEEGVPTDLVAACAWTRRKRVGPFAPDGAPPPDRKVFAAMGRAGFSYAIARRALTMARPDAETVLRRLR